MQVCKIIKKEARYEALQQYYKDSTESLVLSFNDRDTNKNIDYYKKNYLDDVYSDFAVNNLDTDTGIGYPIIYTNDQNAVDKLNKKFREDQGVEYSPYYIKDSVLSWNYDSDFNYIPTVGQMRQFKRSHGSLLRIKDDNMVHEFLVKRLDHIVKQYEGQEAHFGKIKFNGLRAKRRAKSFLFSVDKAGLRDLITGDIVPNDSGEYVFTVKKSPKTIRAYKEYVLDKHKFQYGINHIVPLKTVFKDPSEYLIDGTPPEILMFDKTTAPQAKETHTWVTDMIYAKMVKVGINVEEVKNIQEVLKARYGIKNIGGSAFTDFNLNTVYVSEQANWHSLTEEAMHYIIEISWNTLLEDHDLLNDINIHNHPIYIDHYTEYQEHYSKLADDYISKANDLQDAGNIQGAIEARNIAGYLRVNASLLAYKEVIAKMLVSAIEQESKVFKVFNINSQRVYKAVTNVRDFWSWVVDLLRKIRSTLFRISPTNVERRELNNMFRKWAQAVLSEKDFNTYKLRWNQAGSDSLPPFNFLAAVNPAAKYQRAAVPSKYLTDAYDDETLKGAIRKYKDVIKKLKEQKYNLPDFNNKFFLSQLLKVYQNQEIEELDKDPTLFKFFAAEGNKIKTLVKDGIAWFETNPTATVPEFIAYLIDSRFNNTDLESLMVSSKADVSALKTDFSSSLEKAFTDYASGGSSYMTFDQIIDYMEAFVDWVASYDKGLKAYQNIEAINKTVAQANTKLFYGNEFMALEKLLLGTESVQIMPLLNIIEDAFEKNILRRDFPYIRGIMNKVIQTLTVPGKTLNKDFVLHEIEKEFDNLLSTVVLSDNQRNALLHANKLILEEKQKAGVVPGGEIKYVPVPKPLGMVGPVDYQYITYIGGLQGQLNELLNYMDNFKLSDNSYNVDAITINDFQYVHYLWKQLEDVIKVVRTVHSDIKRDILSGGKTEDSVRLLWETAKAKLAAEISSDPLSPNIPILEEELARATEDYREVRIVMAMESFITDKPVTGSRKGFDSIIAQAQSFIKETVNPLLLRLTLETSTHPSIVEAKTEEDKKAAALDLINKQVKDINWLDATFFALGEDNNNLSSMVRLILEHDKENIFKKSENDNRIFEARAKELEDKLVKNSIVSEYIKKRKLTYVGGILSEYDDKGKRTGNFITEYRRDKFDFEKEVIDEKLLTIAENILNETHTDPNIVDIHVPEHLKQSKHFGRAFSFKHEDDRNALFKHGAYDEVVILYSFPNKTVELTLSSYLRVKKSLMYGEITRDATAGEALEREVTILKRKMAFTPFEFSEYYFQNVRVYPQRTIYMGELSIPEDSFINRDFEMLMSVPEFKEYYKLTSDFLKNSNIKIGASETTVWYKLPQQQKLASEIFNVATRIGWSLPSFNTLYHIKNKFKDIYTRYRHVVDQTDNFAGRVGEQALTDVAHIPYRKVHTRYKTNIPVEELTNDVINSLMIYNSMSDMVHYGTKAVQYHDGLSRLLRQLPWVITESDKSSYTRVRHNMGAAAYENIDYSLSDFSKNYDNLNSKVLPDPETFGTNPLRVSQTPGNLPEIIKAYELAIDVSFNGPLMRSQGFWNVIWSSLQRNVSGLLLKWNIFTIMSNLIGSFVSMNSNYSHIMLHKNSGLLQAGGYLASRILTDYTRFGYSVLARGAQFLWNTSPLSLIKPWNTANGLTKLDYIANLAQVLETGSVRHPRQNVMIYNLKTAVNWGMWQGTDYMLETYSLVTSLSNYRYSAHLKGWYTYEQYVSSLKNLYRDPIKDLKTRLKKSGAFGYSATRVQEMTDKIEKLEFELKNLPAYVQLKSMYDVIDFRPIFAQKGSNNKFDNVAVSFTKKKSKQKIGDGSVVDVDYEEVGTVEALDNAMKQAKHLKTISDGREMYNGQSKASTNWLAQTWLQMKRWVLPNIKQSFGKNRWNEVTNRYEAGFWPALVRILAVSINLNSAAGHRWLSAERSATINTGDTNAVARGVFINAAVMYLLYMYKDFDEERCKGKKDASLFMCMAAKIIALRASLEASAYVISPFFWGEFKAMVTRVPVTLEHLTSTSVYGIAKAAKDYAFGTDTQKASGKYYKPHGDKEFVLGGDIYRRVWEQREKDLLESATPAGGFRAFVSERNMGTYEKGLLKAVPGVKDRSTWVYELIHGEKGKKSKKAADNKNIIE